MEMWWQHFLCFEPILPPLKDALDFKQANNDIISAKLYHVRLLDFGDIQVYRAKVKKMLMIKRTNYQL